MSDNLIFVFGSNLAGVHGKGAAREAHQLWGAKWGVGEGPTGYAYAIPTKSATLKTLPLEDIEGYIRDFLHWARGQTRETFLVTPIGSGLAGHSRKDIADLFYKHMFGIDWSNRIVFTHHWFSEKDWWVK